MSGITTVETQPIQTSVFLPFNSGQSPIALHRLRFKLRVPEGKKQASKANHSKMDHRTPSVYHNSGKWNIRFPGRLRLLNEGSKQTSWAEKGLSFHSPREDLEKTVRNSPGCPNGGKCITEA
ncbi:unnamed protein product [Ranitomeya imitator]|uniref:Protein Wnt n=1 Tax=Ranitomeya imitator TaxID=111125 RepID=A0ABN9MBC1_9NEOB|nr:unnamed protein product [Ranitomeya imitator]